MHAQLNTQKHDRNGTARGGAKNRRTAAQGSVEAKTAAFPAKNWPQTPAAEQNRPMASTENI